MSVPARRIELARRPLPASKVAVLLNANAKKVTERVKQKYEALVPNGDLYWSRTFEEAQDHMATILDKGYGTVFTGGGDGTIVNTIELMFDQLDTLPLYTPRPQIGTLKLGTGNAMAYWLNAHKPTQNLSAIIEGQQPKRRRLMLIEEGNRLLPFAGIGWDAAILNDYIALKKRYTSGIGRKIAHSLLGYSIAIATKTIPDELFRKKPAEVRIRNLGRAEHILPDGQRLPIPRGTLLFEGACKMAGVATMPYYGFGMQVYPYAGTEIGKMHLRIVTMSVAETLAHLPAIWKGEYRSPRILDFLIDAVEIETDEPVPYQIGGDAEGLRQKMTFNISDKSVEMLDFSNS